jgi:CRISPR-associated endoribonuclease Cas6
MITILVQLKETEKILGYEYYHVFHGYISELLGNNQYGREVNDYVYSNICGGRCTTDGFYFPGKPYFYIRTDNEGVWQNFLKNIRNKKNIMDGFVVDGFTILETKLSRTVFETDASTPILVSNKYRLVKNLSREELYDTENYMVESIRRKAKELGVSIDNDLSIKILTQRSPRNINYRGTINKGRNLKLRINCDDKTKEFILVHGIGRSTGCGFGFLI